MLALLAAVQFLTRIPIPLRIPYDKKLFARSVVFFPFAGLLVGLTTITSTYFFSFLFPDYLSVVFIVLIWTAITGALHVDGLLDTADALLSHRNREQMLLIMKDSRIGAMGTIIAIFYFLLKVSLVFAVLENHEDLLAYMFIVITPVFSRWMMTGAIVFWPYARQEEGLGYLFQETRLRHFFYSSLFMCIIVTSTLLIDSFNIAYILTVWSIMLLSGTIFGFMFAAYCTRRIGGMTGDTYGALNELGELLLLMIVVLLGRL